MSVLKTQRTQSKAEYLNMAVNIYVDTIQFLSKLSSRYSRLMAEDIMHIASDIVMNCEKANTIYPSDEQRAELRKQHLLEAKGSLSALDVHLAICYEILMRNPQGCFTDKNGKTISSDEAKEKIEKMAQAIGKMIDDENNMLKSLLSKNKIS